MEIPHTSMTVFQMDFTAICLKLLLTILLLTFTPSASYESLFLYEIRVDI